MSGIIQGDALNVLKGMESDSVDCIMTSPPYWALRDYGVEGQLGLESSFEEYIKKLCDIFEEAKRTLKPTGTCWVNIGDSYAGEMGKKSGWTDNKLGFTKEEAIEKGVCLTKKTKINHQLPQKCLIGVPFRFAIEMMNRGWILRNTIIWHKRNCMPSSAKDRFTVDFEYLFFFVKQKRYYFEQQFEKYTEPMNRWGGDKLEAKGQSTWDDGTGQTTYRDRDMRPNTQGRNKRAVWTINPKPFPEAHFAVYPEKLCETPIKSGCPQYICKKCGKAREKVYEGTSQQAFNIRVRDVKEGRIKHSDRKASNKEVENYKEGETHVGEGKK